MVASGAGDERSQEAGRRIARARSAISSSFDELIARGERGAGSAGAAGPAGDRAERSLEAMIDARVAAAEATLRSRLDAALDERESRHELRAGTEATALRKRLDGEIAAALRGATAELRRELASDRAGSRRELEAATRAETAAAAGRIDELRTVAVRDAARVAEAVAGNRLEAVSETLTGELRRARDEMRAEVQRVAGAIEGRAGELHARIRDEQERAGAEREGEVRRRAEARLDELGAELGARVDRELARGLAAARTELAEAGTGS
ncbi:MAG TPA: hypothetical protein VFH44_08195, partial [Solirubrobacterales bacterium]|nr:hypothetical protein [Solirubrobacterales bacterium]